MPLNGPAFDETGRRQALFEGCNGFLTSLAVTNKVNAPTQTQALCAIIFLYKHVIGGNADWIELAVRAERPKRLPVVLRRDEVRAVLVEMHGIPELCAKLLYGAGLRLMECLEMRVKDLDFKRGEILVRDGKGQNTSPDGIRGRTVRRSYRGVKATIFV